MKNNISTKKTEKKAINKLENLISERPLLNQKINSEDTGISWDGIIEIYKGCIDCKSNFEGEINIQIKGRTTTNKKLDSKCKFDLDKADLENYKKIDGTILFLVKFNLKGEYKIYYNSLLPKNINTLLQNEVNSKNEIKIPLREIKNSFHLEKICREFLINKEIQKKLSQEILENNGICINNKKLAYFKTWGDDAENPFGLLGEEKFIYFADDHNNIIDVKHIEFKNISTELNIKIKNKKGEVLYEEINIFSDLENNDKIIFGKAFELILNGKKFNIRLNGTLSERIKEIEFLENIAIDSGFFINDRFIELKNIDKIIEKYESIKKLLNIIQKFCIDHSIKKDINLDKWSDEEINNLLKWINAIESKENIKLEYEISRIGSIKINELRFSILAEKINGNEFYVSSIWNYNNKKYNLRIGEDSKYIYTKNIFSILNKEAYLAEDINFEQMKESYEEKIEDEEEWLINRQVLEILKAYDENYNMELLNYGEYLLRKIEEKYEEKNILKINFFQIIKRKRELLEEEIIEIIEIRDKSTDKYIKIASNLLIGNKLEANILLSHLEDQEKKIFLEFPIAKFLN